MIIGLKNIKTKYGVMEMKVELKSYTKDAEGDRNLLEQIAYVARVSNPSNQNNDATAEKLVQYLIDHKHWSPLEMVDITLEIETTRDIARQILRHRSFVFQGFQYKLEIVFLHIHAGTPRRGRIKCLSWNPKLQHLYHPYFCCDDELFCI